MRRKRPPENKLKCCVGTCNNNTALFYLRDYPICNKHWDLDCDRKFKYQHFRTLREFLGFPPIIKPDGFEHLDEDFFAYYAKIQINIDTNAPIIMSEELQLWDYRPKIEQSTKRSIEWNGLKKDPIELYTEVDGKRAVLLVATGVAVKFSSEKSINAAIAKLESVIDSIPETWGPKIAKLFKKSKFWTIVE